MKYKISMEFDLSSESDGDATMELFDNYVNYAICAHLRDAIKRIGQGNHASANNHKYWADLIRKAEPTMKIERL